jgi:hypothetical protein
MRFTVSKWVNNEWKTISGVGFQGFTEEPLTVTNSSFAAKSGS